MTRLFRRARWRLILGTAILPAFLLQCDKAALNLQRGFFQGLGNQGAAIIADFIPQA